MRPSPKPHHRMFRLHVRLPQFALTMVVPYWFELQPISEITAELWMDNFRSGLFLPFALYCTEFPMNTSLRTPLGLCFVGSCIQGIQFPPDPMKDQFLSSVCVCRKPACLVSVSSQGFPHVCSHAPFPPLLMSCLFFLVLVPCPVSVAQ